MIDMIRRSLSLKFFVLILGFSVAAIAFAMLFTYISERRHVFNATHLVAKNVSDVLMSSIEEFMVVGNDTGTRKQFRHIHSMYEDTKVYLTDYKGTISYSTEINTVGLELRHFFSGDIVKNYLDKSLQQGLRDGGLMDFEGGKYFVDVKTIFNQQSCYHCHGGSKPILGSLVTFQDVTGQITDLKKTQFNFVIISAAGLVLMLGSLSLLVKKNILNRIRSIGSTTAAVIQGDLDAEFEVRSKDELADLSRHLNTMVGSLKEYINKLNESSRELEQAYKEKGQLVDSISSILISTDAEGRISQWNRQAEEYFGISNEQMVGQKLADAGIPWERDKLFQTLEETKESKNYAKVDDVWYERSDGSNGFLSINVYPIQCEKDRCGFLLLAEDATEMKILENQLLQAQKLESIGQLAAGIAHEINTPVQYIADNTRFLQEAFDDMVKLIQVCMEFKSKAYAQKIQPEDRERIEQTLEDLDLPFLSEEVPKAIEQSLGGLDRVSVIVKSMKQFAHPGGNEKRPVDLNQSIKSTLEISRNEWKYVADMELDLAEEMALVHCYPDEVNQVVLNIIINAAHAIEGVIDKAAGERGVIRVATKQDEKWAEIRISDSGSGIPAEIRDKIFDPFFTTKKVGKGTGQGLNIAHNIIVDKHGGKLFFETAEGKGTTFIIRLPLED